MFPNKTKSRAHYFHQLRYQLDQATGVSVRPPTFNIPPTEKKFWLPTVLAHTRRRNQIRKIGNVPKFATKLCTAQCQVMKGHIHFNNGWRPLHVQTWNMQCKSLQEWCTPSARRFSSNFLTRAVALPTTSLANSLQPDFAGNRNREIPSNRGKKPQRFQPPGRVWSISL